MGKHLKCRPKSLMYDIQLIINDAMDKITDRITEDVVTPTGKRMIERFVVRLLFNWAGRFKDV